MNLPESPSTHPTASFHILSSSSVHSGNTDHLSVYCLCSRWFARAGPLSEMSFVPLSPSLHSQSDFANDVYLSSIFQHMYFSPAPSQRRLSKVSLLYAINTQRSSSHHIFMTQLCNWVFNVCIYLRENRNHLLLVLQHVPSA